MTTAAIYARYSCEKQNETSLEDQLRLCHELAQRHGLDVRQDLIFTDAATPGVSNTAHKCTGYQAFLKAWRHGEFDVFIIDEASRLSRDGVELAQIAKLLESRKVRMLCCSGLDSHAAGWEMYFAMECMLAQNEGRFMRHRVGRGMLGQLIRGYMVATPAYGYDLQREFDAQNNRIGSHWIINAQEAAIVREVYARRASGQSMQQIAAWLNTEKIPCSRNALTAGGGYWRPARVRNLLSNTIYRGVFTWHGSKTYAYRAAKRGIEVEMQLFVRPELRLVSDDTWHQCNQKTPSQTNHAKDKHPLADLIRCGCCGGTLVLSAQSRCRSLYCANCTVAQGADVGGVRQTSTFAVKGAEKLIVHALNHFLTPAFMDAFRNALQLRLTGEQRQQLEDCKMRLDQFTRTQERLSHMLVAISEDDLLLQQRYEETRAKVKEARVQLAELEAAQRDLDMKAMQLQSEIAPKALLDTLLQADFAPDHTRALLARLFPVIRFDGRPTRYSLDFYIEFAAGATLTQPSRRKVTDKGGHSMQCRLKYMHRGKLEPDQRWSVVER